MSLYSIKRPFRVRLAVWRVLRVAVFAAASCFVAF